jgi:hypothetical protein
LNTALSKYVGGMVTSGVRTIPGIT